MCSTVKAKKKNLYFVPQQDAHRCLFKPCWLWASITKWRCNVQSDESYLLGYTEQHKKETTGTYTQKRTILSQGNFHFLFSCLSFLNIKICWFPPECSANIERKHELRKLQKEFTKASQRWLQKNTFTPQKAYIANSRWFPFSKYSGAFSCKMIRSVH